jgi:hypothetical protein
LSLLPLKQFCRSLSVLVDAEQNEDHARNRNSDKEANSTTDQCAGPTETRTFERIVKVAENATNNTAHNEAADRHDSDENVERAFQDTDD